jgi:hypothetical protein
VLYDNGEGDVIYQIPRRYPGLARVVRQADLSAASEPAPATSVGELAADVEAVEDGPAVAAVQEWWGIDGIRVSAEFGEDQALLLQVSYDPAWRAESEGRELAIRRDPLGQMVILVPPGAREIVLRFELPLENLVGRVVSGFSVMLLGGGVWVDGRRGRRRRPVPAH